MPELLAFDLPGAFDQFKPKVTKRYADHSYGMNAEESARLEKLLGQKLG